MRRLGALVLILVAAVPSMAAQWRPGGVMRIVLLVDSSSSSASMITPMRAALNMLVDELPGEPEIAFVTTGGQLHVRVPPTVDRQKIRDSVNLYASDGGANAFIDSLLESDERFLKKARDFRSVFVIVTTDAGNSIGDPRIDAYNRFVQGFVDRGGRAHAIVIRPSVNSGVTTLVSENLTRNSGGYYQAINVASGIPKAMSTLLTYLAADQ